ncbi:MAG: HEAT repeat domain-containing protein [Verrucomicrobia bacterium]|nr:MAG: HEAT repeat domain-containing protein [Verrucomicrobiota bacterium]
MKPLRHVAARKRAHPRRDLFPLRTRATLCHQRNRMAGTASNPPTLSNRLRRRGRSLVAVTVVMAALVVIVWRGSSRGWWHQDLVEGRSIPAWLAQAATGNFTDRLAADRVLESLGPRLVPSVRRVLRARDDGWYQEARRRLAAWFPRWFRPPSPVQGIQIEALERLRRLGPDAAPAAPEVLALLARPDSLLRRAALDCLESMGTAAGPALIEALPSAPPRARAGILRVLAPLPVRLDAATLRPLTLPLLGDPDTAGDAARMLLRFAAVERDADSFQALDTLFHRNLAKPAEEAMTLAGALALRVAHPGSPELPQTPAGQLPLAGLSSSAPDAQILGRLIDLGLNHREPVVRLTAAEADWILHNDPDRVVPVLRAVMENPVHIHRAALLVRRMGPAARPLLPDLLAAVPREPVHRPDRLPAMSAMAAAAALGPAAVPGLCQLLDHPAWETRVSAARALELLGPAAAPAVSGLIRLLAEDRPESRVVAAQTLGAIGSAAAPALPLLERIARTTTGYPQDAATQALERIRRARAAGPLDPASALADNGASSSQSAP